MLDPTDPYPTGYVLPDTWGASGATSQQGTLRRCVRLSKCASDSALHLAISLMI